MKDRMKIKQMIHYITVAYIHRLNIYQKNDSQVYLLKVFSLNRFMINNKLQPVKYSFIIFLEKEFIIRMKIETKIISTCYIFTNEMKKIYFIFLIGCNITCMISYEKHYSLNQYNS